VRRSRLADARASVEALLEPGPSTIRPHAPIEDLAARLARSEVRTLIVTDPDGKLLGVVRRSDIDEPH
jgi:CBS-domain-containing membrane protein